MIIKHYDVIIVGAGIVGLTLANFLHKQDFSVCVLESQVPVAPESTVTARVSAIHLHSKKIFEHLSCWALLSPAERVPVTAMHVWDHAHNSIDFDNDGDPMSWIVSNHALVNVLQTAYQGDYFCPETPLQCTKNHLRLQSGKTLSAELIIGADGAQSWVRQQMPVTVTTRSYAHKSIIAVIQSEAPHGNSAYQRFLKTGPVALLPLADPHHAALVWSADNAVSDALMMESDASFSAALTTALEYRLGKLNCISPRRQFELVMRHATEYGQGHFALVGDAAHTIHPLAGLGVNLGLMDAACLTEIVCDARAQKKMLYDPSVLRRYTRWRKTENNDVMLAMRGLQVFFALDLNLINAIRGLGVTLVDRCTPLKTYLMRAAMGSDYALPRMLLD